MVAGLKSMDYETRLAVLDLFPLEYRRLRGDLILTYVLFEQGLANRFFTVEPANTRRGHGERQLLNDKNKTDPGNLGESLDPVYQSVNPNLISTMDHSSYCGSAWTLGIMEPNGTSLSDLLTDHTYALQPFSSSAWTTCLESDQDWSPDAVRPSQAETSPVNEDYDELNQRFPHVPYLPLLDYPNPLTNMTLTTNKTLMPHRPSRDAVSRIALLVAYSRAVDLEPWTVNVEPPTASEVYDCICSLERHRAFGPEDLQPASFKDGGVQIASDDVEYADDIVLVFEEEKAKCRRRPKPATYICPHCQTTFSRKFAVTEHIRMPPEIVNTGEWNVNRNRPLRRNNVVSQSRLLPAKEVRKQYLTIQVFGALPGTGENNGSVMPKYIKWFQKCCHATRRKYEGGDTARLPNPKQEQSRCRGLGVNHEPSGQYMIGSLNIGAATAITVSKDRRCSEITCIVNMPEYIALPAPCATRVSFANQISCATIFDIIKNNVPHNSFSIILSFIIVQFSTMSSFEVVHTHQIPAFVDKIIVSGLNRTEESLIKKQFHALVQSTNVKDLFERVSEAKKRLDKLGVFRYVYALVDVADEPSKYRVIFKVEEKRPATGRISLTHGTDGVSKMCGSVRLNNLLRGAEFADLDLEVGSNQLTTKIATLSKPLEGNPYVRFSFGGTEGHWDHWWARFLRHERSVFSDVTVETAYGVHKFQWDANWREVEARDNTTPWAVRKESGAALKVGLKHTFEHDTRSDMVFPDSGFLFRLSKELASISPGSPTGQMATSSSAG
ncbi:sorting and assembly machinery component 50 homolog A, partial [Clonorchis sinensis]